MTQYTPPVRDNVLQGDVPFMTWDKWFRNVGIRSELALFNSELTTAQTNAEAGIYCNCYETVAINVGEFLTVDSNSQVTVSVPGYYNISFSNVIRRTLDGSSTSGYNVMRSRLYINAVNILAQRGVIVSDASDKNYLTLSGSVITEIASGDTVRLHCDETSGAEVGNDLIGSSLSINLVHRIV